MAKYTKPIWDFENPATSQEEVYFENGKKQVRWRYKMDKSGLYSVQDIAKPSKTPKFGQFIFGVGKFIKSNRKGLFALVLLPTAVFNPVFVFVATLHVLVLVYMAKTLKRFQIEKDEPKKPISSEKKYKEGVAYRMQYLKQFRGRV
jgi:hypothetical protein